MLIAFHIPGTCLRALLEYIGQLIKASQQFYVIFIVMIPFLLTRRQRLTEEKSFAQSYRHSVAEPGCQPRQLSYRIAPCLIAQCLSTSGLSLASQLWASFITPSNRWLRKERGRATNSRAYRIPGLKGTILGHCPDPSSDVTTLTSQSDTAFHSPPRRMFHCCSPFTLVFN